MIASFDSHSGIVYIQVNDLPAARRKTVEFDPETILELDEAGGLVAVEMTKPSRATLNRIMKKFGRWELSRVNIDSLKGAFSQGE